MKRIIVYMKRAYDGSFSIHNDIFEKDITEENIQLFLAKKEDSAKAKSKESFHDAPAYRHHIRCDFISITTLDEK